MDTGQTHSDDETRVVSAERATKQPQHIDIDLDDAFSDGDDLDVNFEFSSASIREEFARNHNWPESEDTTIATPNSWSAQDVHDSISTIDIGGCAVDSPPSPSHPSRPQTPDSSEFSSNEFSHASLSDDPTLAHDHSPNDDAHEQDGPEEDGTSPYPIIHIDISKSPSSGVALESVDADVQIVLAPSDIDTDHESQTPHSAPATSSAATSIQNTPPPLSPSSSLQVPASLSNFAPGHRPTRSMGPTVLQKVISKTRPSFLPPKSKEEDKKHMADWENMMKQSRAAGA